MSDTPPSLTTTPPVRLLAEIAFTGIFYGLSVRAKDIFAYIEQKTEYKDVSSIGHALAFISDGKFREAVETLEKGVLKTHPDSAEGQLFLALSLKLMGQSSHAERLCDMVAKQGGEKAQGLAEHIRKVGNAHSRPQY